MKLLIIPLLLISTLSLKAQNMEYVYRNPKDSSYNCYLKVWPETELRGIIIRDYSRLPDSSRKSPYQFVNLAMANGFMVLYTTTTNYFPELYYDDHGPILLDEILNEVFDKHTIPKENIFIGGISASGTRALRFTQFCNEGKSKYGFKIKGVFAVDSPIDNERFYRSASENGAKFKKGLKEEAEWMMKTYPEKLGGSPDEFPDNYLKSSVYSQSDSRGGNIIHFKDQSILIFHEPDIEWWLNERGATYYDFNSYDLAGFTRDLIHLGNEDVELFTSTGRGFKGKERNCHSWTIVDEEYLFHWLVQRVQ